ncbi:type IV secretory pathway VirB10-like protein [Bradyrhizobium sp. USDA 3240]
MKRFCLLVALMLFMPLAHAGEGISFSIGGHRVHLDSTRFRSLSCVSVSGASRRDDDADNGRAIKPVPAPAATAATPATPAASALPAPMPAAPPAPPPNIVYKPAPVAPAAAPPP